MHGRQPSKKNYARPTAPEKTNALLGFLGQLTNYSYDTWLARGGMQDAME